MTDRSRRTFIVGTALALGMAHLRHALAQGTVRQGVARVRGEATVNARPVREGTAVKPGDIVVTGPDAELVFVVGRDAFMVRANSRMALTASTTGRVPSGLRILTGALLSVFTPRQPKRIQTTTATIGIRGTGIYVEAEAQRTYACTCYGEAELVPLDDPQAAETVRTRHHDQPRFIYPKGMPRMIEPAPVVNHTDAELILLESLVGRKVPFDTSTYRY